MGTTIDMRGKSAATPTVVGEGGPAQSTRPPLQERHPFTALPPGWAVVGRCRFGTGLPGPHATGCYALAHPTVGVALIDIAPNATPNAEARLRRALTAAEFWPDFPGTLPVMHDRVEGAALRSLPWVLERGFATLPQLTVPGGEAWIDGLRKAIASDPAWELPGQPKVTQNMPSAPTAEEPIAPPPASRSRPKWKRLAVLPAAFAATFAVGLVSGLLLLDAPPPSEPQRPAPPPPQAAAAPAPAPVATTAVSPETTPPPAAAPPQTAAVAAPPTVAAPAAPEQPPAAETRHSATTEPASVQPGAPPSAAVAAVQASPPPAVARDTAEAATQVDRSGAPPRPETQPVAFGPAPAVEEPLPAAPPRAPVPPVRVSAARQPSRSAPVIDRACSRALFRFQQGERLTAAEQNFIRIGCNTFRR